MVDPIAGKIRSTVAFASGTFRDFRILPGSPSPRILVLVKQSDLWKLRLYDPEFKLLCERPISCKEASPGTVLLPPEEALSAEKSPQGKSASVRFFLISDNRIILMGEDLEETPVIKTDFHPRQMIFSADRNSARIILTGKYLEVFEM